MVKQTEPLRNNCGALRAEHSLRTSDIPSLLMLVKIKHGCI